MTDKSNYINEVSSRYAKALLIISKKSSLEQIKEDFHSFIELLKSNEILREIINNPLINSKKKASILEKVCKIIGVQNTFQGFIKTLTKHSKIVLIDKVFNKFNKLLDIQDGFTEVHITTSNRLETRRSNEIEKMISEKINRKVKLKKKVDPEIIGGIIIQIDSYMIDNSVRSKLSDNNI